MLYHLRRFKISKMRIWQGLCLFDTEVLKTVEPIDQDMYTVLTRWMRWLGSNSTLLASTINNDPPQRHGFSLLMFTCKSLVCFSYTLASLSTCGHSFMTVSHVDLTMAYWSAGHNDLGPPMACSDDRLLACCQEIVNKYRWYEISDGARDSPI